jgi:signal transduction histidine kinase
MVYEYFHLEEFIEEFLARAYTGPENFEKLLTVTINAPVMVKWDRFRIEQVILNLLTNAVRHGNNSAIHLNVTTGGGYMYIKVKDHGPGIPKANHKKIFERYERINHNREKDGFGLGLYLCGEIMKFHQGKISLESNVGEGACFELQIPLIPT